VKPLSPVIAFTPLIVFSLLSLVLFTVVAVLGFTLGKNDDPWLSTWGGAAIFAAGVSPVAATAIDGHTTRRLPETLVGPIVPVEIIISMLKVSKSYPDKIAHHEPAAGAPAGR